MGSDNFAKFKIFEEIGRNGTKIIPEIMMNGGESGSNPLAGLATIEMLGYLQKKHQVTDVKSQVINDESKK